MAGPQMFLALLAVVCPFAQGQIFQFEKVPLPEAKSLHTMYAFYIYSHSEAPDRTLGQPFIKFHSLSSHSTSTSKSDADLANYEGVQLSILPYKDFWTLIIPDKFCSTTDDVQSNGAEHPDQLMVQKPHGASNTDVNLYSHTVKFHAVDKDYQFVVHTSGVYILVYSNCGSFTEATVSGSVVVKNSYGFLPGNEYYKMPFYGWLSFIYAAMAFIWLFLSIRQWRQIFHIQYCIAAVIFLGLIEAFLWWVFFNDWNHSGLRGRFLFIMAILSSVVKSIFSYMLVLVASLGWGVTRPYLDHRTIMKVQGVSFLYIVLDFIREAVLSFRHSHSLSLAFVLLCLLPVALLNGGIFYWIFTALSSLIETLKERRQAEKMALFERLWQILVLALGAASLTLLFQIFDLSRSISIRWHYQWFFADGVSHILFLLVLAAMMYLWTPGNNSQRYMYSAAADKELEEDGAPAKASWAEEPLDDDGDDDSFWATTHAGETNKVAPVAERVGATAQDDDGDGDMA